MTDVTIALEGYGSIIGWNEQTYGDGTSLTAAAATATGTLVYGVGYAVTGEEAATSTGSLAYGLTYAFTGLEVASTIGTVRDVIWDGIDLTQTPNWVAVTDAQTNSWSAVATTQTSSWVEINDTQ